MPQKGLILRVETQFNRLAFGDTRHFGDICVKPKDHWIFKHSALKIPDVAWSRIDESLASKRRLPFLNSASIIARIDVRGVDEVWTIPRHVETNHVSELLTVF